MTWALNFIFLGENIDTESGYESIYRLVLITHEMSGLRDGARAGKHQICYPGFCPTLCPSISNQILQVMPWDLPCLHLSLSHIHDNKGSRCHLSIFAW